jgi:hypothetical protein
MDFVLRASTGVTKFIDLKGPFTGILGRQETAMGKGHSRGCRKMQKNAEHEERKEIQTSIRAHYV